MPVTVMFSAQIRVEHYVKLKELSKLEECSMSAVIRKILRDFFGDEYDLSGKENGDEDGNGKADS